MMVTQYIIFFRKSKNFAIWITLFLMKYFLVVAGSFSPMTTDGIIFTRPQYKFPDVSAYMCRPIGPSLFILCRVSVA